MYYIGGVLLNNLSNSFLKIEIAIGIPRIKAITSGARIINL